MGSGLRLLRNPLAAVGFTIAVVLILTALLAQVVTHGVSPLAQDLAGRLKPPSAAHWFGTDELGRHIVARTVYGARATLAIVALVAGIVVPIGLAVGTPQRRALTSSG